MSMKIIKENKGVIIFYLMIAVFTFILVENAKINNNIVDSYVMVEK